MKTKMAIASGKERVSEVEITHGKGSFIYVCWKSICNSWISLLYLCFIPINQELGFLTLFPQIHVMFHASHLPIMLHNIFLDLQSSCISLVSAGHLTRLAHHTEFLHTLIRHLPLQAARRNQLVSQAGLNEWHKPALSLPIAALLLPHPEPTLLPSKGHSALGWVSPRDSSIISRHLGHRIIKFGK